MDTLCSPISRMNMPYEAISIPRSLYNCRTAHQIVYRTINQVENWLFEPSEGYRWIKEKVGLSTLERSCELLCVFF